MTMPLKPDKKINTAFTLDPRVISIIDNERGDMPRSKWVNDLILTAYGEKV